MGLFFCYAGQTPEKVIEDQVFMNCMKIVLFKQQTVFMNIHEILPEIHFYHNCNKSWGNRESCGGPQAA